MPKVKNDPDAVAHKQPGKKDTKRWCKGKVGREHVKEWQVRHEFYLHDLQYLLCINCGKVFDYRYPCTECGEFKCGGHREPFHRQRRKYPHVPMGPPLSERHGTRFREGTSYRRKRSE